MRTPLLFLTLATLLWQGEEGQAQCRLFRVASGDVGISMDSLMLDLESRQSFEILAAAVPHQDD